MTNLYNKYDIVLVKFPFVSSLKYKVRPAVIISSDFYNSNSRNTVIILAISSQVSSKLNSEIEIVEWKSGGLLKESIFKSNIATIQNDMIHSKLGILSDIDKKNLDSMVNNII